MKRKVQALQMQPMAMDLDQPLSCHSISALQAWVGAVNRLGEVGALRELAAAAKGQR